MATFDQLSDEQRAIVELVLRQGKSYDELADMLDIPEARVRERARDALVELAPISARGVEEDWRGQLADYVLGQQAGPEATATRGHLRRSEAARSWTRSLLDSLEQLYGNGDLPAIPDGERAARASLRSRGERGGRREAPGPPPSAAQGDEPGPLSPSARAAVLRRRILAGAAVVALLLVGVLVWPGGVLTGGDDDGGGGGDGQTASEGGTAPIDTDRVGSALIAEQGGKTRIIVTAEGLEPSSESKAYQVWLYDSASKRRSLGATATDQQGNLQVVGDLPADYQDWNFIDVTPVTVTGQGESQKLKDGPSILRGALELAPEPIQTGTGKNKATVLATIPLRPLPD
jgi:Sigma-70, region 4/Anti-sigma-K factor rskA